jgi:hypothetical protein
MERVRWTDERLDRQMSDIDKRFERLFDELRADRQAWQAESRALRADMQGLRAEMQAGFLHLQGELHVLQRQAVTVLAALSAALLGVVGAGQL